MTQTAQRKKTLLRSKRRLRVRGRISGTEQKPRVSVFRSNRYLYAQAIDDTVGKTLASADGKQLGLGNNKEESKKLASSFAVALKAAGIQTVVFDRNGYLYHGVIASFADALREHGITL